MNLRQRSGIVLSVLILALAALGLGVFTNVISDMWGQDIQQLFRANKWLLIVLTVALAFLGYWYAEGLKKEQKEEEETIDEDRFQKALREFRDDLIIQYQIRLNNKVTDRLPVNLAARSTDFGTSEERARLYFDHKTIESADIASEAGKILETVRRLLIIGEPGAGKTTIVLYTALDLLRDEKHPRLPLILNLASWRSDRDFEAWYVQNMAQSYNLSPLFAKDLLRRNLIVPVFDGFDEIHEDHRDDCFLNMKAWFGDSRERRLIVCSRKAEYAAAQADAPVYCELEVQPLTLDQIKFALSLNAETQRADRALLDALGQDEWLCKAVETPFYLNTASYLFGKGEKTWADFDFTATDEKGRKREITERFVAEQVPAKQDRRYLRFLAWKMKEENLLVLEMLSLQPDWCGGRRRYRVDYGLAYGLAMGLIYGLVIGLGIVLVYGLVIGLVIGLGIGLVIVLVFRLVIGLGLGVNFFTSEIQSWSWQKFRENWKIELARGLALGLGSGLYIGLVGGLVGDLVGGLVFGLVGGLVGGLGGGFKNAGTVESYLLSLPSPYQRFWSTFLYGFGDNIALVLALLSGGISYGYFVAQMALPEFQELLYSARFWQKILACTPLLFILPFLASGFLNHFSLRLTLYLERNIPLRLVTFLDRMSDRRILEDNRRLDKKGRKLRGASWRFRHKILQDYFAELGERALLALQ